MVTTSITLAESPLTRALLSRADDALVLGHRLSEWTGHAPLLEEELALANIALDLIGQARALYTEAGTLTGQTEDQLAYLRDAPQWRNALIMELPNGDFAFTMARLLLVSAFAAAVLAGGGRVVPCGHRGDRRQGGEGDRLSPAPRGRVADPPGRRHRRIAPPRAGCGGRAVALHRRTVRAPRTPIWSTPASIPDPAALRSAWEATVGATLARATLTRPADGWMQSGGRAGRHTEHLGHLLAELQFVQRAYPGATW